MSDIVAPLLDWVAGLPLWALVLAAAVAVACESSVGIGLVVPGDLMVLLAASSATSAPRVALLVAVVTAGSVGGEALGYAVGRRWGARIRASRVGRAIGEERWGRAGAFVDRQGSQAVFLARYVAAVHAVLPVVAGTLRMPFRRFLGWSAAGALSWATLYVAVGAAAGASVRTAGDRLDAVTLLVVGALVGAAAFLLLPRVGARKLRPVRAVAGAVAGAGAAYLQLTGSGGLRTVWAATVVVALAAAGLAGEAVASRVGAPSGGADGNDPDPAAILRTAWHRRGSEPRPGVAQERRDEKAPIAAPGSDAASAAVPSASSWA